MCVHGLASEATNITYAGLLSLCCHRKVNVPLSGDLTEQEQEDAELIDENDEAELMSQLFEHLESGEEDSDDEDCSEEFDDDEDGEDHDDDEEEDDLEEEDEEDDDVQERGFAFFGMGGRALAKQLARHPKLSTCKHEPMLHPAAQLLNLSSAAINAKHCLSSVGTHGYLISQVDVVLLVRNCRCPTFHVPACSTFGSAATICMLHHLICINLSHCATNYISLQQRPSHSLSLTG